MIRIVVLSKSQERIDCLIGEENGGLGIEAISRGMDQLYSVDKQYRAFLTVKDNVKALKIEDVVHIYKMDYWKALLKFAQENICFDLVLLDPPYSMKVHQKILDFSSKSKIDAIDNISGRDFSPPLSLCKDDFFFYNLLCTRSYVIHSLCPF